MDKIMDTIKNFLDASGKLKQFPAKRKLKIYSLFYLAGKLEAGKKYTEKEINDVLDSWTVFKDHATLRREMYDYKLISREDNGTIYWLEVPGPDVEEITR